MTMDQKKELFPLGFGTGRLPEIEADNKKAADQELIEQMIQYAVAEGVNYFDTAPLYCNEQCEQAVGKAVHPFRNSIYLGGKLQADDIRKKRCNEALKKTLSNLQTDYLDYYFLWGINRYFFDETILQNKVLEQMQAFRKDGLIRNIAFSYHGDNDGLKYIIDAARDRGISFDACLVQYNLLDRSNEDAISYAHELGLKTIIMGPVAGGRLAVPSKLYQKVHGAEVNSTYELALRFVLSNPNVDVALSGMSNMDMVRENTAIAKNPKEINRDEIEKALIEIESFKDLYCTGCRYCQPCPANIQIQDIFKCYTIFHVYDLANYAKGAYERYKKSGAKTYADCLNCCRCEEKCPQKLPIRFVFIILSKSVSASSSWSCFRGKSCNLVAGHWFYTANHFVRIQNT